MRCTARCHDLLCDESGSQGVEPSIDPFCLFMRSGYQPQAFSSRGSGLSLKCSVLTDACLTLHAPTPSCSSTCPKTRRPFRISVFGRNASQEVDSLLRNHRYLKDPIDSFRFRHLEYDIFPMNMTRPPTLRRDMSPSFTMMWPAWEGGFGDLYMWTLIPLGNVLAAGNLPNTSIGISGALFTRAWEPIMHTGRRVPLVRPVRANCVRACARWPPPPTPPTPLPRQDGNPLRPGHAFTAQVSVHLRAVRQI